MSTPLHWLVLARSQLQPVAPLAAVLWCTVLGAMVSQSCGTGTAPWEGIGYAAACAAGLIALRLAAESIQPDTPGSPARREAAQVLAMGVAGAALVLAARSSAWLLPIGAVSTWAGWRGLSATQGAPSAPGWRGLGAWSVIVGADVVQRQGLSEMGWIAGGAAAMLVAAMPGTNRLSMGDRALMLLGAALSYGWLFVWWWKLWLPTPAWWALLPAPLNLLAALWPGSDSRWPLRTAQIGWAAQSLGLIAAFLDTASLR